MKKIIVIYIVFSMFSLTVNAYSATDYYKEQLFLTGADSLQNETDDSVIKMLDEVGIDISDPQKTIDVSAGGFFSLVFNILKDGIKKPLKSGAVIIAVIILGSFTTFDNSRKVYSAVPVIISASALLPVAEIIILTSDALSKAARFFSAFIPVFATVLAVSGKKLVSSGFSAVMLSATQGIELVSADILIPLSSLQLSLALCSSITNEINVKSFISAIKKTSMLILSFLSVVLTGVLSIKTFVSAPADSLAFRSVKFLAGSTIPVVGATVGEALGTVGGCLKLLKSNVAVFGVAAVIILFLPVLVCLVIYRIVFLLCSAVSDIVSDTHSAELLRLADSVVSFLMGIIILMGTVFIISVAAVSVV